ncbi:hypothetical protein PMG11_06108 [Penicillium brasilianum]|uniref:Macro domain-containing protein n=1 Tax=Penicillium brasilianum TaxID=104259 RepID=A0A0F7TLB5_PENBI|nr:hypothetical protein PMG11_06108 [Penicillium brasilianum]
MPRPVLGLHDIPTVSELYRTANLGQRPTERTPVQSINDIVSTISYDITKLEVDCIVNAANSSLLGGGGVDGAIHSAAGRELFKECATLNGCEVGDAKITSAYRLPCQKVVHTVGPIYDKEFTRDSESPETLLRSCYRRSLEVAVENNMKSIAFAAISTGIYGYPSQLAAIAAADEVRKFLELPENKDKLERVIFCNFEIKDETAYRRVLPKVFPPTKEDLASAEEPANETDRVSENYLPPKKELAHQEDVALEEDSDSMEDVAAKEDRPLKGDSNLVEDVASNCDLPPKEDRACKDGVHSKNDVSTMD